MRAAAVLRGGDTLDAAAVQFLLAQTLLQRQRGGGGREEEEEGEGGGGELGHDAGRGRPAVLVAHAC